MFDNASSAVDRLRAAARAENRAAGERLVVIGELDVLWLRRFGERETWGTDTHDAINAEIAAALSITRGLGIVIWSTRGRCGCAYRGSDAAVCRRHRLPDVSHHRLPHRFDYRCRGAGCRRRRPGRESLALAGHQPSPVGWVCGLGCGARRPRCGAASPGASRWSRFSIFGDEDGLTEVFGRLVTTDAHAVDARLDALAATVCANDPRTRSQRRADAMGALAVGADRLGCRCGQTSCPAGSCPPASPVVIHVVAEEASLGGASKPGSLIGSDALIPAELVAELACSAKLRPLIHPADTPPEPGYRPSRALADFVRCRDLTCRFPGCDRPASRCDIDHTVPHGDGGATHASNLKTLCRLHHLMKTFWGWRDQQLADGAVIWTSRPDRRTSRRPVAPYCSRACARRRAALNSRSVSRAARTELP